MTINLEQARGSRAWPFQEAERLLQRVEQQPPPKGYVLFETGYGSSGLPHIGTFGEVFRTAMAYYEHFVKPQKRYRTPTAQERAALEALATRLMSVPTTASAEDLQSAVYAIGKAYGFANLRDWFGALYAVLLGQKHGPRMGSFIALYGVPETVRLIHHAINCA